jgi:hypothetical protein
VKHVVDDELDKVAVDVDEAISWLEVAVEADEATFTGTASCDVVLEQPPEHGEAVVTAPLFVPRYMTRPIITTMAMTIAATTAAATPARDFSNFIPLT